MGAAHHRPALRAPGHGGPSSTEGGPRVGTAGRPPVPSWFSLSPAAGLQTKGSFLMIVHVGIQFTEGHGLAQSPGP